MHSILAILSSLVMRALLLTFLVLVLFVSQGEFAHGQSCDCEISDATLAEYNALLNLDPYTREAAFVTHLPWGIPLNSPTANNEQILVQQHYVIDYDADLRIPVWTAYRLTADDLSADRDRIGCFRRDPRITSDDESAFCEDYDEPSGVQPRYDRGHMVPSADMKRSEAAMINTYMFSNMTPQHDGFNRFTGGLWFELEDKVRKWAKQKKVLYVISGAVFDRDDDGERDADDSAPRVPNVDGTDRVAIPSHFYKIVLSPQENGFIETITVLLPHEDEFVPSSERDARLADGITSIDAIEDLTGIDFLPSLQLREPSKAQAVEQAQASELWAVE